MGKVYKVYCEFFVRANNQRDVEDFCKEDVDFIENHVLVRKALPVEYTEDDIYEDLTY